MSTVITRAITDDDIPVVVSLLNGWTIVTYSQNLEWVSRITPKKTYGPKLKVNNLKLQPDTIDGVHIRGGFMKLVVAENGDISWTF